MENLRVDSACIKVHKSANGEDKTVDKAIGHYRDKPRGSRCRAQTVQYSRLPSIGLARIAYDFVHVVELMQKVKINESIIMATLDYGSDSEIHLRAGAAM